MSNERLDRIEANQITMCKDIKSLLAFKWQVIGSVCAVVGIFGIAAQIATVLKG